jgi:hypothetical protein
MTSVFVICAALGGTILVCQVLLGLLGLGGDAFHGDAGGGFDADVGSTDVHLDLSGGDHDLGAGHGDGHGDGTHGESEHPYYVARLFGVLSFRSVVAALTFFGLSGLAAQSAGASRPTVFLVALGAGAAALYGVYFLMRSLYSLKHEGTAHIERAVGRPASVYLRIPGQNSGTGKIQLNLQNRTMEYLAVTVGDAIPTGARVVVSSIVNPTTVVVEAALQAAEEPVSSSVSPSERNDHV